MSDLNQIMDPSALEELFNRDPLKLTDNDVEKIVNHLQELRKRWAAEEQSAKQDQRRPKVSVVKPPKSEQKDFFSNLKIKL